MTVTTFYHSDHFLDEQKHQYAGQDPQSHSGFVAVVVGVLRRRRVGTTVFGVVVVVMVVVVVSGQGMRDQVQERIAQQSAGRETQQYL